ncbi:hypothetical protein JHK87_009836 [Glycine soja]|nr:hypothetical protein JHK87_009836 [Glycine soja]
MLFTCLTQIRRTWLSSTSFLEAFIANLGGPLFFQDSRYGQELQRLELVPVVVPSVVESIPTFLLIKERVSSLWRKDFNTKALIQASMLGQSYKDMLREAKRALVEVIRANKTLLLSAEESRESLTHVETKLKEYKPREKALNINLTTAKNLAKALQEKVEHLNK